jgi:DNA-binding XRE family transcriptional regulator
MGINSVKRIREKLMMSKSELASKAGISDQTINNVEKGNSCRTYIKRRIILALGYNLSDKDKIFPENEAPHRKRWGIKRNYAVANPASLLRASPWFTSPFIPAASRRVFWRRRIKVEMKDVKLNGYLKPITFTHPKRSYGCT